MTTEEEDLKMWPTPQAKETGRSVEAWDLYNRTHKGGVQRSLAVEAKRSVMRLATRDKESGAQ